MDTYADVVGVKLSGSASIDFGLTIRPGAAIAVPIDRGIAIVGEDFDVHSEADGFLSSVEPLTRAVVRGLRHSLLGVHTLFTDLQLLKQVEFGK